MDDFSMELCGGTHLKNTAGVGLFKLVAESSVGAGLRRIEAVTGKAALQYVHDREEQLARIAGLVKQRRRSRPPGGGPLNSNRELEAENETLQARLAKYQVHDLLNSVKTVKGVKVLAGAGRARRIWTACAVWWTSCGIRLARE